MISTFKIILFCLIDRFILSFLSTHNYNYSRVHDLALVSEPLFMQGKTLPNAQHPIHIPKLIQDEQIRKYQLRDTGYQAEDKGLTHEDQRLLFSLEPVQGIFASEVITIENYKLLEMRKFKVEFMNPSERLRMVVIDITTDRAEVRRDDERGSMPMSIPPRGRFEFNFVFYVPWLNPQHLQSAIYFFVEIYDGTVLAEEKVYARKVVATITPNHLRLETHVFKSCPRYQTLTLKNYEIFEIGLALEGKKKFQTVEGVILEGEIRLQPTKTLKILMEGKSMQMIIHTLTGGSLPAFPSLMVQTICEETVTIDYFNIGILPDERTVFSFPITISTIRNDNVSIEEIQLQSTSQTVIFEEIPGFGGIVHPQAKCMQIGLILIYARKQPEKSSSITIRMRISSPIDQFWTVQKFVYQELRNPVSAGTKRFIDLRKVQSKPERLSLKNNLNLPLFLTRYFCDESILQLSWTGERRKIVYPNHSVEQLSFMYVGPRSINLSPQKHVLLLQFNGNVLVPIEIVVYDQSLQCLLDNEVDQCANISIIDFGYFRDQKEKERQLIVRNWNPEGITLTVELPVAESIMHGIGLEVQIYGPLPSQGEMVKKDKNFKDFHLKPNHFIMIHFQIELLYNATSASLPLRLATNYQQMLINLMVRVQNGTIALIPQVVRFQAPLQRTIDYLNLVSTYSQKYRIANVSTNLSNVIVSIPPHGDLQANQFVGMTVVYDPYLEENATDGDWSLQKKQSEYFLYRMKREFQAVIYAQVRLTTTTGLEAKSTIIIEKNYPPLIGNSYERQLSKGVKHMKFILSKRRPKTVRFGEARQAYEISVQIKNNFLHPMKYRPFLVPEIKFSLMDSFFKQYRQSRENKMERMFFCLSEALKSKHKFTAHIIRQIFEMHHNPEQYTLQVSLNEDGESQMNMFPKSRKNDTIIVGRNSTQFKWLNKLNQEHFRHCYYIKQHEMIVRLVYSELLYKLLEEDEKVFRQFIKAQIHNVQHMSFFESDMEGHVKLKQDYYKYCWQSPEYVAYRFCDSLMAKIQSVMSKNNKVGEGADQSYVLEPLQAHKVTLLIANPLDKIRLFLILANNITKFETYQIEVQIKSPSVYIKHDYISPLFNEMQSDNMWGKWKGANLLPIELYTDDYRAQENVLEGMRVFEIVNQAEGDVTIDHIGIDEKYYSCGQKGIAIFGLTCRPEVYESWSPDKMRRNAEQPFLLKSMARYNFTIKFVFSLKMWLSSKNQISDENKHLLKYVLYLYDQKGYHFKLHLVFRIADPDLSTSISSYTSSANPIYGYFAISGISFLIITLLLLKIKDEENNPLVKLREEKERTEEDPYKRLFRLRRLGRILKEHNDYGPLGMGAKLQKRVSDRSIHRVTEDLLLSAKEVTQRELKKYFNESEESAIGAFLELNHHLSLSQSISDHEVLAEQPQERNDPSALSFQKNEEEGSSSDLPEGEEVDLTDEIDENSWYDFNRELLNESHTKSHLKINLGEQQEGEEEFYNVFRSDVGLKITAKMEKGKTKKL